MQITITEQERDLLARVVGAHHATLREEIHKTEGHDFKEQLKEEETIIKALLAKLGGSPAA